MFSFAKFRPTEYVIHYSRGKIKREGRGLSFLYWRPTSSIVVVSVASSDLPFVFNGVTSDFQSVAIQGQLTYRVAEPRRLAELLDLTVAPNGEYLKRDTDKIGQRLINEAHTATTTFVAGLTLKEALRSAEAIAAAVMKGLSSSPSVQALGIQAQSVAVVAVSTTPDMSRALEAEAREALSQQADMAIYARRNNAVSEERKIKESELNTEIAVEEKRRQIRETQMQADVSVEEKRRALIDIRAENERKDADTRAYAVDTLLKSVASVDWKTLLVLTGSAADSKVVMAHAFRELAENAQKIGNLNLTPDLLAMLMSNEQPRE